MKTRQVTDNGDIIDDGGDENKKKSALGRHSNRKKIFSQKVFKERESLLTVHEGQESGIRTLENIFIAFLILLGLQVCFDNYFDNGKILPEFDLFYWAFGKPNIVYPAVFLMYLISFLTVPLIQSVKNYKLSYCSYVPLQAFLQVSTLSIGIYACAQYSLPPASAMIVSCEMARVSMKMHAYFREKIVNGLERNGDIALFIPEWAKKQGVKIEDIDQPDITVESITTELRRFGYFFLAPTLVYRDTYARTKAFRMKVFI